MNSLTRRSFIKTSTGAAGTALAAPLIFSRRALGADTAVKPGNRITMGFIGTGRQCLNANLPALLNEDDVQVVAVCDADAWRMNFAKEKVDAFYAERASGGTYKGCAAIRDFRELLARGDIDAVMISTPDHWHVPMALAAVRAGKDVCCEKPLTRNVAEGRRLADLAAKEKRVFRTDSEFRSLGRFHHAAQLVRNGRIGKLTRVITATPKDTALAMPAPMPVPPELDYDMWLGPAPEAPYTEKRVHTRHHTTARPGWITIREYADGMIANWGAHLNDIALWGANLERTGPVTIAGTGTYPPAGNLWDVILDFSIDFTYANGLVLTCKTDSPYVRFEGTEGWIQVPFTGRSEASHPDLLKWKPGPSDLVLPLKPSEKRDFLDAVKSRGNTLCDAEVGHRVTCLAHLGLAAVALGRPLKWDPVKEEPVGRDDEARALLKAKPARAKWAKIGT